VVDVRHDAEVPDVGDVHEAQWYVPNRDALATGASERANQDAASSVPLPRGGRTGRCIR
jgi:hypothetical protein